MKLHSLTLLLMTHLCAYDASSGQDLNVIRESEDSEILDRHDPEEDPEKVQAVEKSHLIFDRVDINANGVLEPTEFKGYLDSLHQALVPFLPSVSTSIAGHPRFHQINPNFWPGFTRSLGTIWATEIGDKTFFIAAILSMQHDRLVVYTGAIGALAVMTVLSVLLGSVVSFFLPPVVTHYIGMCLFLFFGVKMIQESKAMEANQPSEELAEVEEELMEGKKIDPSSLEASPNLAEPPSKARYEIISQSFLLTFIAEWGDRSQIATITLSTTNNPWAVNAGAILGHAMCTGLAVMGGKVLATRISEKTVTCIGGIIFLIFALHSLLTGPPTV